MIAIGGENSSLNQERDVESPTADSELPRSTTATVPRLRILKSHTFADLEDGSSSERSSLDIRKKKDRKRGYSAV